MLYVNENSDTYNFINYKHFLLFKYKILLYKHGFWWPHSYVKFYIAMYKIIYYKYRYNTIVQVSSLSLALFSSVRSVGVVSFSSGLVSPIIISSGSGALGKNSKSGYICLNISLAYKKID